jgi:hypothetical protein
MNTGNSYASQANVLQTFVLYALLFSVLVCTLCTPAMAVRDPDWCNTCSPPDENGMRVCTMHYCGPVIFPPEPLPPCCIYGPRGEPYCFGFGRCDENPFISDS